MFNKMYLFINIILLFQYLRLRRNCSDNQVFQREADLLCGRLLDMGYSQTCLKKAFRKAKLRSKNAILYNRSTPKNVDRVRFITTYSDQHGQVREIMNRHWHLLTSDPILCKYIKEYPEITFKWSGSITGHQVKSHYTRHKDQQEYIEGIFRCGLCELLLEGSSFRLPNGHIHSLKHHVTCFTKGIIYIILCQCGTFYNVKTIRLFWKYKKDHMYYDTAGILNNPIRHHITLKHNYYPSVF